MVRSYSSTNVTRGRCDLPGRKGTVSLSVLKVYPQTKRRNVSESVIVVNSNES